MKDNAERRQWRATKVAFIFAWVVLGLSSLAACASTGQSSNPDVTETAEQIKADPNVSCKPTYTQVYQPPLKLGGTGRVIQVPSGEKCEHSDKQLRKDHADTSNLENLFEDGLTYVVLLGDTLEEFETLLIQEKKRERAACMRTGSLNEYNDFPLGCMTLGTYDGPLWVNNYFQYTDLKKAIAYCIMNNCSETTLKRFIEPWNTQRISKLRVLHLAKFQELIDGEKIKCGLEVLVCHDQAGMKNNFVSTVTHSVVQEAYENMAIEVNLQLRSADSFCAVYDKVMPYFGEKFSHGYDVENRAQFLKFTHDRKCKGGFDGKEARI